jgi:signal transduction histidine kinase
VIAAVSHELRQPLASIRGFTEMLLSHWADFAEAEKIEMLEEILHDSIRLGRLVDELLDVYRLESGRSPLHRSPTDIGDVVARVVARLGLSYPDLVAIVELPERLPAVWADAFKLEQVLTNIVENACKHGSAGTVRITGRYEARPGRPAVEIAVHDSGPGIRPEQLPHVTEKYFRSSETTTSGLGLGLWFSKEIVEAHGGVLEVISTVGQGTTVSFTIPVAGGTEESRMQDGAGTGMLAGS